MNIFIFEDNKEDEQILIKNLKESLASTDFEAQILSISDEKSLFKNLFKCDILFLDIELDTSNGIEIGKKIKKIYPEFRIVIISNYQKYLTDGYKIHADRYFLKPLVENEFHIEVINLIREFFSNLRCIRDEKIKPSKIYVKDILYVEAMDKHTLLHMINEKTIRTPYTLKEWIDKLSMSDFAQSHKSFYINLNHVSSITRMDVILFTDELVPLSRNYKKAFEERYISNLYRAL